MDTAQAHTTPAASAGKTQDAAVAAHGTRAPPSNAGDSTDTSQHAGQHPETIQTTTNHPWMTAAHGWLPADFLRIGERVVRADGGTATVVAVRAVAGVAAMWDLTIGAVHTFAVHTFAVGNGRYVVHNCGGAGPDRAERVRQSGYQGKGTGAGAVAENTDGTVTAEDFSHSPTEGEQHIYDVEGHTNGGRCAETWCADAMGAQLTDGNRGSKITMYMSHRRGYPPCTGFQRVLSQLAADNGADVEVIANGADRWIFQPDGSILR